MFDAECGPGILRFKLLAKSSLHGWRLEHTNLEAHASNIRETDREGLLREHRKSQDGFSSDGGQIRIRW